MASIVLNGRNFTLSALTLGDLRKLEHVLLGVEARVGNGFGSMLSLVPVIHASLSKLHPEVALEELEEMLDLSSFSEALDRALEVSGLKRSVRAAAGSPADVAVAAAGVEVASGSVGENQPAAE